MASRLQHMVFLAIYGLDCGFVWQIYTYLLVCFVYMICLGTKSDGCIFLLYVKQPESSII